LILWIKGDIMAQNPGIVETLANVVGFLAGGPKGYAAVQGVGTLFKGGSFQDAVTSGLGAFMQSDPKAMLLGNMLGGGGGGSNMFNIGGGGGGNTRRDTRGGAGQNYINPQSQGNNAMFAALSPQQQQQAGMGNFMQDLIGLNSDNPLNSLLVGGFLNSITNRKNPLSDFEQRQFASGERNPDYRGTPAPDYRYMQPTRPQAGVMGVAQGGMIDGPGGGKSDSIPAQIYQAGAPVQEARLSDGEFVMTADAVRGAGGGDRSQGAAKMYRMMNQLEGSA
jgi:hypothetical protein